MELNAGSLSMLRTIRASARGQATHWSWLKPGRRSARARQLTECLAQDGLAVTLQNGLGNRETLIQSLGPGRVALGVTTTGATLLEAAHVKAGGEGPISIERNPALGPLGEVLRSANFNVQIVEDRAHSSGVSS